MHAFGELHEEFCTNAVFTMRASGGTECRDQFYIFRAKIFTQALKETTDTSKDGRRFLPFFYPTALHGRKGHLPDLCTALETAVTRAKRYA